MARAKADAKLMRSIAPAGTDLQSFLATATDRSPSDPRTRPMLPLRPTPKVLPVLNMIANITAAFTAWVATIVTEGTNAFIEQEVRAMMARHPILEDIAVYNASIRDQEQKVRMAAKPGPPCKDAAQAYIRATGPIAIITSDDHPSKVGPLACASSVCVVERGDVDAEAVIRGRAINKGGAVTADPSHLPAYQYVNTEGGFVHPGVTHVLYGPHATVPALNNKIAYPLGAYTLVSHACSGTFPRSTSKKHRFRVLVGAQHIYPAAASLYRPIGMFAYGPDEVPGLLLARGPYRMVYMPTETCQLKRADGAAYKCKKYMTAFVKCNKRTGEIFVVASRTPGALNGPYIAGSVSYKDDGFGQARVFVDARPPTKRNESHTFNLLKNFLAHAPACLTTLAFLTTDHTGASPPAVTLGDRVLKGAAYFGDRVAASPAWAGLHQSSISKVTPSLLVGTRYLLHCRLNGLEVDSKFTSSPHNKTCYTPSLGDVDRLHKTTSDTPEIEARLRMRARINSARISREKYTGWSKAMKGPLQRVAAAEDTRDA